MPDKKPPGRVGLQVQATVVDTPYKGIMRGLYGVLIKRLPTRLYHRSSHVEMTMSQPASSSPLRLFMHSANSSQHCQRSGFARTIPQQRVFPEDAHEGSSDCHGMVP